MSYSASTHLKEYLKRLSHRSSQQLEGAQRSLPPEGPLKVRLTVFVC